MLFAVLLWFKYGAFKLHESYLISVASIKPLAWSIRVDFEVWICGNANESYGKGEDNTISYLFMGFSSLLATQFYHQTNIMIHLWCTFCHFGAWWNHFPSALIIWKRAAITFFRISSFLFYKRKSVIHVWVRTLWQSFHFWVNYSLKMNLQGDILRIVFSRHGNSMCQKLNVHCHHFLLCFLVCNCCALSRKILCCLWWFQMSHKTLLSNMAFEQKKKKKMMTLMYKW